ncbi:hypothetical protein A0H81_14976 [Grifola frondosa]|uniref:Uncharacterized protein n=1 Tax=Grifola frondosa TaxID=5627 RepID=A0A1C7LJR0_GRIFR|nr:hypothetical protein A0H81_14976 [Grifola frondosa]
MTIAPQHTLMRALEHRRTLRPNSQVPHARVWTGNCEGISQCDTLRPERWQAIVAHLMEQIYSINCDQGANTCAIQVPAPGTALVFVLPDSVLLEVEPSSTVTFATAALTKTVNTVTIDASVLATFNEPDRAEVPVAPQDAYASVHPGDPLDSAMLLGFLHNRHTVKIYHNAMDHLLKTRPRSPRAARRTPT